MPSRGPVQASKQQGILRKETGKQKSKLPALVFKVRRSGDVTKTVGRTERLR